MSILTELNDDRSEKVNYDNPDYPIYIRRDVLSTYPNYAASSHWHDDIELIAVLEGKMNYNVNGEVMEIRNGEGIFVNAEQLHFGYSDSRTECIFICIKLHPMLLCANSSYERDFVLPVICSGVPFVFLKPDIDWQRAVLEQICRIESCRYKKSLPLKIQSSFFEIWSLLYDNLPSGEHTSNKQNVDLTIFRNMVGFIQKNYTLQISLSDIAGSGAVGQSKCCKLFAKYFSRTPNTYLNKYRLDKSLELLCGSDMSVTEIALSVGFGGASYYAETFRRYYGKSPTEYRKSILSKELRKSDI